MPTRCVPLLNGVSSAGASPDSPPNCEILVRRHPYCNDAQLLVRGWLGGELATAGASVFLALWLLGLAVSSQIPYLPFASVVALLDVVLVLIVVKGDVKIT